MKRLFLSLFTCAALLFKPASAEEVDLERIVVTPYRYPEEFGKIPAAITVISRGEIDNSSASSIADILRPVAGLSVRDFFGNAAKVSVDIRGFGEMAGMNVLVLIDGRRVNEIDLSAVSWDQIPLSQVEKIEVLRGAAGSVLYGDNASGGVINIITKKGRGKPHFDFEGEVASYSKNRQSLYFSGEKNNLSFLFGGAHQRLRGYRQNNYYRAKDFSSKLNYRPDPGLSLRFSNSFHSGAFGLPGALRESQLKALGRRATVYPDDRADDKDFYFSAGLEKSFFALGSFDLDLSFRSRQVYSHLGSFNPIYQSRIDTLGITPKYIYEKSFFNFKNKLIAGFDFYRSDYMMDNYGEPKILQNTSDINKASFACYLQDELLILENLTLTAGYRFEKARYEFNYHDFNGWTPDVNQGLEPKKNAYQVGAIYRLASGTSAFFNFSRSFRFPAPDEYFSAFAIPPVNLALRPQSAHNYEAGIKQRFASSFFGEVTLFFMDLKNELFYNPLTYANENYPKTRRHGAELSLEWQALDSLHFQGAYSFLRPQFSGGIYDGKDIPMAPRQKASIGLSAGFLNNFTVNLRGNYTGARFFINDPQNNFSPAAGYFTLDANLAYRRNDLNIIFGIINFFDKKYSEYVVYSTMSSEKAYYPAPGRNFYIRIKHSF